MKGDNCPFLKKIVRTPMLYHNYALGSYSFQDSVMVVLVFSCFVNIQNVVLLFIAANIKLFAVLKTNEQFIKFHYK